MNIEDLYKIYLQNPSIQTDTRKLKEGDIFFALKGPNFNGNHFAQQAINSGASYAVIDEEAFFISGKTLLVDDVLGTLHLLARHHRQEFKIPFIAITGSNGKTTTKELIHVVLSSTYKTYTTEGNLNNHIGVPLTILKIKPDAEFAVIEMGANHLGEIKAYCGIASPTYGLITNCGKAHLEGFGSEENIRRGKGELYDFLHKYKGTAFVMTDYDYLQKMSEVVSTVYTYGIHDADITGDVLENDPFLKVQFTKGFEGTIETNLVGAYNLPNILAAVAVGKFFNVSEKDIRASIKKYEPSNSRSQLTEKGSNKIILDAYNANPSSMKAAIENFSAVDSKNKVLVLGAMAEMGNSSLQEHKILIEEINRYEWNNVLLVGDDFLKVNSAYLKFTSVAEAGKWLQQHLVKEAYILIKGSRSMQMEKILDYL